MIPKRMSDGALSQRGWVLSSNRIVQQTLEGLAVSAMPRVRTTDGHLLDWDRDAIAKQLLKEMEQTI